MSSAPKEIERSKFDEWLWRRGIDLRQAADAIECSIEQVRLIRLPFGDPKRRVPSQDLMERIVAYTEGAIGPADFYPEHLSTPPPANDPRGLIEEQAGRS